MKRNLLIEIITLCFIVLFIYAASSKLIDFEKFKAQIGQSPILTDFTIWIAWAIPIIEILISATLAVPRFRLLGLYASFSLMVLFTSYIIAILRFSDTIPCSCGGILENISWNQHLLFNILCILLALLAILLSNFSSKHLKRSLGTTTLSRANSQGVS